MIIDAQVHAYERDRPERPWTAVLHGPPEVTGDDMVAAMDAVGVDGAILVSPYTMYRFDASYAIEVHAAHPDRFGLVKPIDPSDPAAAETVAAWAETPGAIGVRIMMYPGLTEDTDDEGINRIFDAAGRHGLPLNLLCWGRLGQVAAYAGRHANTQIVIDHVGLRQPFEPPVHADPWAGIDNVVGMARFDNVAIKITGACTLSEQPFPYDDLWRPLGRLFDGFGFDRCLWGTDWTRAVELLTYEQGVEPFRLTDQLTETERAALMGGTLQTIYGWTPARS